MASRVLTIPPHLGHVLQETGTIFELVQDIKIRTNVLTMLYENWIINMTFSGKQGTKLSQNQTNLLIKFHEDVTINVASRVLTWFNHIRQNALPPGGHVFQQTRIILELKQDVVGTYVVAKFHTNQTIKLASWVLTWKKCPAEWRPYFTTNWNHFQTNQTINVASRVFTMKIARPRGGHVFQLTETIFELVQSIIETNLLTKFHDDRTINVASKVKNARPHGGHVFQQTGTISELIKNIFGTCTKFPLTRKNARTPGGHVFQPTGTIFKLSLDTSRVLTRKNCQLPCDHIFQQTGTIFILVQYIIGTNLLTKFHDDWTINVVSKNHFQTRPRYHWDKYNLLTYFHEDRTTNVATIVLTSHITKNAPPPGGHIFQATTNLLTKFHEDWTINVASIVFPRKMLTPHNGTKSDHKSSS
ncbi:hypothetical protein DPMN_139658 [Dreissena polymorpha]|uniref:Uncharacterized protein n=1 Tax=Dreissena polymorpha TaxID=45954 RepID=A0A9D4JFW0_DREPO|nr:hypothetical protein DPMN_139658 [Dreissena polymorpha]